MSENLTQHQIEYLCLLFSRKTIPILEVLNLPRHSGHANKSLIDLGLVEQRGEFLTLTSSGESAAEYWGIRTNLVK